MPPFDRSASQRRPGRSLFTPLVTVGLLPALLACGAGQPAAVQGAHDSHASTVPPQLAAERVQVVEAPDRPLLQLVRRNGDPYGAVALAAFPEGGSRAAVALGALLHFRLTTAGIGRVELQPHAFGVVVAAPAEDAATGARLLQAFRAALAEPVSSDDPALPQVAKWARESERRAMPSAAALCEGELGSDLGTPSEGKLTGEQLESWRESAFSLRRVGLAALGSEPLLQGVRDAHREEWPEGAPPSQPWPEADDVQVVDDGTGRALRLGWHLPQAAQALSVARSLADPHHPLRQRLEALGRWRVSRTNAAVRPRGACLRVDLALDKAAERPDEGVLARAASVVSLEIERALEVPPGSEEHERTLLAPGNPLVAAALAAWTAVRAAEAPGPVRRVVEYAAPSTERRPTPRALGERLQETRAIWESLGLPLRAQVEDGQAETWILVASPCGTSPEPAQDAGIFALATHSIARAFQGSAGVTLEPWATPDGVGLLGHAPRRARETPKAHAERIARALGRALAGDPLDGRAVADARDEILDRLGADTGWWLALETLSGDFPSALEPFGTWKSVSTTSTSGVERARAVLAQAPLRVAVLADHDAAQAEAAGAALSDWLAPFREEGATCARPKFEAPKPGMWTLETIDEEVREGAYLGVWAPAPREVGLATAYLLNRPGGWLDQALTQPGLVGSAQAHWYGGGASGALVIELGAVPEQLDAAIQQARALLDRLAKGAADKDDAARARAEQNRREAALAILPRARAVQLWHDREPTPVDLEGLHKLHEAFAADHHLVVKVKRRQ